MGEEVKGSNNVVDETKDNKNIEEKNKEQEKEQEKDGNKEVTIDENKIISEYLRKIGLSDNDSVEDIIKKHNEDVEKNKTETQKKDDIIKSTTKKYIKEKERADEAEAKLIAYQLGCKKELVDDVVVIAKSKLKDGKSMSDIITEIKNSDRGSFFFDIEEDEEGEQTTKTRKTKSNTRGIVKEEESNKDNKDKEKESVVDRLFKNKKEKKSYYFKN